MAKGNIIEYWQNKSLSNILWVDSQGNLHTERWVPIKGYEGLYEISDIGRVKTMGRKVEGHNGSYRIIKTRIRNQFLGGAKKEYCRVELSKDGKNKKFYSHRLVGLHFVQNNKTKPWINHKKGHTKDNRYTELEWNTISENTKHGFDVLNRIGFKRGKRIRCQQTGVEYESLIAASNDLRMCVTTIQLTLTKNHIPDNGLTFEYVK